MSNDLRLRILGNYEVTEKFENVIEQQVPSLPAKMKILLILAKNSWKTEIKLFPKCFISHEN